jgi:crotonobetainyl-CoA:carnitine CoA-transferase CaiB-like acyl-CoA transferase
VKNVLTGVTVLEFNRVAPASLTAMLLGDLGARIIKVESLPAANAFGSGVSPVNEVPERLASNYLNRGKESVAADLKSPVGQRLAATLCAQADVVIDGFRPGVLDRLGLGFEQIRTSNKSVIYCSMTGYGQTGPYRDFAGHDLNYLAVSGVLQALPQSGDQLVAPLNLVADFGAASMFGFSGVLAALIGRAATGEGQQLDLSYLECTLALAAGTSAYQRFASEGTEPNRSAGVFSGRFPYYRIYRCADDQLLSIACTEPGLWKRLCGALERPDLLPGGPAPGDLVGEPSQVQLDAATELQKIFPGRARDAWVTELSGKGVGVGNVNTLSEVGRDPQLLARHALTATARGNGSWQVAPVLGSRPDSTPTRAPLLGEHTLAICEELGLAADAGNPDLYSAPTPDPSAGTDHADGDRR